MKIKDEIIGKEVMDNQGALVGKIKRSKFRFKI